MRHETRVATSIVGPSTPMSAAAPTGPSPTISTGFSSRRRSR